MGKTPKRKVKGKGKEPAASTSTPPKWTLDESRGEQTGELTDTAREKLNTFTNAVAGGMHPKKAAEQIGDSKYTRLDKKTGLHEIRLDGGARATFQVNPKTNHVTLKHFGSHT